jgi:hypothetical protein
MEQAFQILIQNFDFSTCEISDLFNTVSSILFGILRVTSLNTATRNTQADTTNSAIFHFKIYGLLCVTVNTCVWTTPINGSK